MLISKASLGPYAWQHNTMKRKRSRSRDVMEPNARHLPIQAGKHVRALPTSSQHVDSGLSTWKDLYLQYDELVPLQRSQDVFRKVEADPCLSLNLPKPRATAGAVLQHSARVFEKLLEAKKPMTFKFGITHDAAVRWHNAKFGYKFSKDRFEHMVILYAAANPHGPAFLEAALIDRFGSSLFAVISFICFGGKLLDYSANRFCSRICCSKFLLFS